MCATGDEKVLAWPEKEPSVRQHLIDIVLVIAFALGLFLTTTWVQSRQEAPVVEQSPNIMQQGGPSTREVDRLLVNKD